jgi:hypothetical protein
LITVWSDTELDLKESDFYLISLTNKEQIVLDKNLELPLMINGSYKKIKVENLFNDFKEDKFKDKKIELFKYESSTGMKLKIKENKVLTNLFEDFSFKMEEFKNIKIYSKENGILIYDMIKKVMLIDEYLVLIPIEKKEKIQSSFLEINQKDLEDKMFMLEEGIKLIEDDTLKDDLLKIAKSIK